MTNVDSRVRHDVDGLNSAGRRVDIAGTHETPLAHFFTRSHAPIPSIDPAAWRLVVDGLVDRTLSLSLADLHAMPRRDVSSTLLCAGLRRDELLELGPLPGELPWGPEAASHATWTGVSLIDVLYAAGVAPSATHVEFTGLDDVERHGARFGFGGSITLHKAKDPDVLLAFGMNGAPLAPRHGFPVRTIVPGWIGARSVKWLGRITVSDTASANYFQTKAYRILRVADVQRPGDVSAGDEISAITINSVLLDPSPDQRLVHGSRFVMRGWAIGTDGASITRVECSTDDGRTWQPATLLPGADRWSWTRWEAGATLDRGSHVLCVRCFDAAGNSQPQYPRDAWNVKGYLNNAWHRIRVSVD